MCITLTDTIIHHIDTKYAYTYDTYDTYLCGNIFAHSVVREEHDGHETECVCVCGEEEEEEEERRLKYIYSVTYLHTHYSITVLQYYSITVL
jgi:predicted oxidoreductase